jgi:hypothetical protein
MNWKRSGRKWTWPNLRYFFFFFFFFFLGATARSGLGLLS